MILTKEVIRRLKKPSVILSIVSQVLSLLMLIGLEVDNQLILSASTIICSLLVTLGILSNPDTVKKGYGDDVFLCLKENKYSCHVEVNGQMVCKECGCVHA